MPSYWEKKYWFKTMDYTVVGSGIIGLLSAIYIRKKFPDARISILEREAIPYGASTRNAGFACFRSVGELLDDLSAVDNQTVIETLRLRYMGLQLLAQTIAKENMDYKPWGGYEVFQNQQQFELCAEAMPKINKLVAEAINIKDTFQIRANPLKGASYNETIFNPYEGQLNPVKLVVALRKLAQQNDIEIYSGFGVKDWVETVDQLEVSFSKTEIKLKTRKLILATNAFTSELIPGIDIQPKRNQVLVSQPLDSELKGTFHYDKGYIYFRNLDNRLLIGGARNLDPEGESTSAVGRNEKLIAHLTEFAQKNIDKNFKVNHNWSGIIATGDTKSPIVKYVSDHILVAARMGGMGVAIGAQIAQQVSDLV